MNYLTRTLAGWLPLAPRFRWVATLLALSWACLLASAQNLDWIVQFGTNDVDLAYRVAPDGSGGVYVCGYTSGSLGGTSAGDMDAWIARYDSSGAQVWIRQLGTNGVDLAYRVAPDGSGGVYVCGYTSGILGGTSAGSDDAWVARYDSSGAQMWIRQFGTDDVDSAWGVSLGGSEGFYVCGDTNGSLGGTSAGGTDAWVARYDNLGAQVWIRQLGTNAHDWARSVAPDGSGGVYVCGYTNGNLGGTSAGDMDAWVARYDSSGVQVWITQLGTNAQETAWGAAPDGSGGVYVCGYSFGSLGGTSAGEMDVWVTRYDSSGAQLWMRQLGTSGFDLAYGVASDGSGGVYVCGWTNGSLGGNSAGSYDAWAARYDNSGAQTWIRQLGTSDEDLGWGVAPDGLSGVFICGETKGSLGGNNSGGSDAWVVRLDTCSASTYCTGAINSTGQGASIGYLGSTSIGQNDLVLTASGCPPTQPGIFIMGKFQTQAPFGEGWLCLTGGVQRLLPAVFLNSSGAGSFSVDFTNQNSPASQIVPGSDWNFQFWYRDPQLVGAGFNLSNGLSAHFCP